MEANSEHPDETKFDFLLERIESLSKKINSIEGTQSKIIECQRDESKKLEWLVETNKKREKEQLQQSIEYLSKEEISKRSKDHGRENFKILYGIVKVIGFTTATIVLLNLLLTYHPLHFSKSENFNPIIWYRWHRYDIEHHIFDLKLIFWITSCMVLVVTYDAAMFSTIALAQIHSKWTMLLIFSFIGFEFFLFAVLYPNFFVEKDLAEEVVKTLHTQREILPNFASFWFVIYGTYHFCIGLMCIDGIVTGEETELHNKELKKSIKEHYIVDAKQTFIVGFFSLAIVVLLKFADFSSHLNFFHKKEFIIQFWMAVAFMVAIIVAFFDQYRRREKLINLFNKD